MEKDAQPNSLTESTTRISIDPLMTKFQQKIGNKWEEYRDTLTHFLMGKLSKKELTDAVSRLLGKDVHFHNYLLLSILTNAFRELPPGEDTSLNGWKQKSSTQHTDTPIELLHKEIMTLPPRERRRIRNITKDPARKLPNPQPTVVATRQAMLPKIPYVQDKKNGGTSAPKPPPKRRLESPSEQMDGLHPPRLSGPLMWTQDIIHGFDAPLASESYEISNDQNTGTRMLQISLENGLLRGIDAGTTDIMMASLESYLNCVVSSLAQYTRNFTNDKKRPLTANDLNSFYDARAVEFQETLPPIYRMKTEFLNDEESYESHPRPTTEMPSSMLELLTCRPERKRSSEEADLIENSNQGKKFVRELLE